ncbi:hypothetical protein G6F16_006721 [Rhizopus arrhizus]|nr:hypothetical protein G6F24_009376 [Rhizopus arrhizus]KAG0785146.1 hypothetical protein G6F21_009449 [Rhizopus arrhizus]KAG0786581.1 hypothetical protein G6F22_007582 [Rhizopus arrhizus]KAG0807751.1 hypothetical protein G6F20_010125 [Rhizopus arrhizus]KAG0824631.1 hypothetical protein G6F19_010234 [Rhizopus arrhizus]
MKTNKNLKENIFTLFGSHRYAPLQQLQQLQADLATVHAEIRKLQQENSFLRKQLALKPSITYILPSSSGRTSSPTVSFLPLNPPTPSKRPLLCNNISSPPPKVVKPKRDNSQLGLTAIAR